MTQRHEQYLTQGDFFVFFSFSGKNRPSRQFHSNTKRGRWEESGKRVRDSSAAGGGGGGLHFLHWTKAAASCILEMTIYKGRGYP